MKNNQRHILIIHPRFCIRARKQIEGLLNQTNYKVTLISNLKILESIPVLKNNNIKVIYFNFHNNFIFRNYFKIIVKKYAKNVDIIHCHNEPNYHIVDIIKLFKGKIPIVYDIHDIKTLRNGKLDYDEDFAYKNSDAIIHVSKKRIKLGERIYGKQNCHVIMSTPSIGYIHSAIKKKKPDDGLHFVYQGGIYDMTMKKDRYSFRYYLPYFQEILSENHHIHVYTNTAKERIPGYIQLDKEHPNFHFHGNKEYSLLIEELSRYDYGIAGFNINNIKKKSAIDYLDATIGNKLFDYIFAGIPVVVLNSKEMEEFVIKNKCGFVKLPNKSWSETIKESQVITNLQKLAKQCSMEVQIEKLVGIYKQLW